MSAEPFLCHYLIKLPLLLHMIRSFIIINHTKIDITCYQMSV